MLQAKSHNLITYFEGFNRHTPIRWKIAALLLIQHSLLNYGHHLTMHEFKILKYLQNLVFLTLILRYYIH